ncbi:hypothetical protein APA_2363 [Pseudanabaena sp. lw0831]|nr:hypothetical protein APA_2363 [Pseudanabaena sp. lw0831]
MPIIAITTKTSISVNPMIVERRSRFLDRYPLTISVIFL